MPTALPHSHLSMRSKYITGTRCSIRPGRGAYRADLAPVGFNTAPSQRAGDRRSNRYAQPRHGTCFERPGSTPRLRFAAFGLSMNNLWTQALQRAVRLAAYCSNFHPCGVRFALATPPDRELSPSRHIAAVRTSPPQNGKYATDGSCSQKPRTRSRTGGAVSCRQSGIRPMVSVSTNASFRPSLSSAKKELGRQ